MFIRVQRLPKEDGFALVEVVLALGIVSFALVAIIGLLPIGLKTTSDAREQTRAITAMNVIALGLEGAALTNNSYTALFPYTNMQWSEGDTAKTFGPYYIDGNGNPVSSPGSSRLAAAVSLSRATTNAPWNFYICIAWPGVSQPFSWSGSQLVLTRQQGYVDTVLLSNAQ